MAPGRPGRRRASPLLNELLNELRLGERLTRRGLLPPNNLLPAWRHRPIGIGIGRLGFDLASVRLLPTWINAGIASRARAAETRDIADGLLNVFGTSAADRAYPPLDLPLVVETEVQLDWVAGEPDPWQQPEVMADAQAAVESLTQRGMRIKLVRGKPVPANRYDPALAQPASAFGLVGPGRPGVHDQLDLLDQAMPVAQRPGFLHVVLAPRATPARYQAANYLSGIRQPGEFVGGVAYGPALPLILAEVEREAEESSAVEDGMATATTATALAHRPPEARTALASSSGLDSDARAPARMALPSHAMSRDISTRFRRSTVSPLVSARPPLAPDEPFLPGAAAPPAEAAPISLPPLPPAAIQREVEPASLVPSAAGPGLLHGLVPPSAMGSTSLGRGAEATVGFPGLETRAPTLYNAPLPLIFPESEADEATEAEAAAARLTLHQPTQLPPTAAIAGPPTAREMPGVPGSGVSSRLSAAAWTTPEIARPRLTIDPRTSLGSPLAGAGVAMSLLQPRTWLAPGETLTPALVDRMMRVQDSRPPAPRWPERIEAPGAPRRADSPEPVRIVLDWVAGHDPWQQEVVVERARQIARSLESQGIRVEFVRGREVPPHQYAVGQPGRAVDFSLPGPTGPVVLDRLDVLEGAMLIAQRPGLLHVVTAPAAASTARATPGAFERIGLASGLPGTRMADDESPWSPLNLALPPIEAESDVDLAEHGLSEVGAPDATPARRRETQTSRQQLGERELISDSHPRTERLQVVLDWVAGEDPWRGGSPPIVPPNVARDLARRGLRLEFVRGRALPAEFYEASQGQRADALSVSGPRGPVTLGAVGWLEGAIPVAQRPGQLHLIVAGPGRSPAASQSLSMPLARAVDVSPPWSGMPSDPSTAPGTVTGRNEPIGLKAASGIISSWVQGGSRGRGQLVPDEWPLGLFERSHVVEEAAGQTPGWPEFEPLIPAGFGEIPGGEDASSEDTAAPADTPTAPPSITLSPASLHRRSAVASGQAQWPSTTSAGGAFSRPPVRAARSGAHRPADTLPTPFDGPGVARSWAMAGHEVGSTLPIASRFPLPLNLVATSGSVDSDAGTFASLSLPPLPFADADFTPRTTIPSASSIATWPATAAAPEEVTTDQGYWPVPGIATPMNVLVFDVTPAATELQPLPMASPSFDERPAIGTAVTQVGGGTARTPSAWTPAPAGRPDLPPLVLAKAAAPDVLPVRQQDVARAETGRPAVSAPQSTAASSTTTSVDATQTGGAPAKAPDLDLLARQVYGLIKRRLVVERERTGMSRGVRPW